MNIELDYHLASELLTELANLPVKSRWSKHIEKAREVREHASKALEIISRDNLTLPKTSKVAKLVLLELNRPYDAGYYLVSEDKRYHLDNPRETSPFYHTI